MDTTKSIAKAVLNKSFAEAKELVFKALYAKSSLALDEARLEVANSVFNEAKKTTGVPAGASEDKFAAAREEIKKAGHKAKLGKGVPAGRVQEEAEQIDETDLDEMAQTAARKKEMQRKIDSLDDRADRAYTTRMTSPSIKVASQADKRQAKIEKKISALISRDNKEYQSPRTYGRGGKLVKRGSRAEVKEEADQLDEVSPPGMEKMTGSKKTKASFAKQYGKRGKSVMYATAWKLHNKKAND